MKFPTERREQIVMGLSICALILFVANMATFIKQRFFDDHAQIRHAFVVGEGTHEAHDHSHASGHNWGMIHLGEGNVAWSVSGSDVDRDLDCLRREIEALERSLGLEYEEAVGKRRKHRRHVLALRNGQFRDLDRLTRMETERVLQEARRAAERIEIRLDGKVLTDFSAPRLKVESITGDGVSVSQSQDETGRHRYEIVVKPDQR